MIYVKLIGVSLPHLFIGIWKTNNELYIFSIKLDLGDRWFGCKAVSMVRGDQSARDIVTNFNEDLIDLTTDLPKNDGWEKYFEFTHAGQEVFANYYVHCFFAFWSSWVILADVMLSKLLGIIALSYTS